MTRVSYTITAKELTTPVETVSYKDVLEAKEKLHNVKVVTHYERIPEPTPEPTGMRAIVLKYQGFIRPSTFNEDYQKAIAAGVV